MKKQLNNYMQIKSNLSWYDSTSQMMPPTPNTTKCLHQMIATEHLPLGSPHQTGHWTGFLEHCLPLLNASFFLKKRRIMCSTTTILLDAQKENGSWSNSLYLTRDQCLLHCTDKLNRFLIPTIIDIVYVKIKDNVDPDSSVLLNITQILAKWIKPMSMN